LQPEVRIVLWNYLKIPDDVEIPTILKRIMHGDVSEILPLYGIFLSNKVYVSDSAPEQYKLLFRCLANVFGKTITEYNNEKAEMGELDIAVVLPH
jgi:hypothetical protein